MQTKTAKGARDILALAENLLAAHGRPRKPLGKPRPLYDRLGAQMSMVGAITMAARRLGASRRQLTAAFGAVIDAAWDGPTNGLFYEFGDSPRQNVQHYDDMELDARETVRTIARAIKHYI